MTTSRIAGLMPVKWEWGKSNAWGSIQQLQRLCDVVILAEANSGSYCVSANAPNPISADNEFYSFAKQKLTGNIEIVRVDNFVKEWDDFGNRMTLLARAAAHRCHWCVLLDDDELLEPKITRDIIQQQISAAEELGCVAVRYEKREMWDMTHYRNDGVWKKQKIILQKNPLIQPSVTWAHGFGQRLHHPPLQTGEVMESSYLMLHYGMSSPQLRRERHAKYRRIDPDNAFQADYNYMIDELGIELVEAPK